MVLELLEDMLINNHLIAAENKAAVVIIKQLETHEIDDKAEQLYQLLHPPQVPMRSSRTVRLHRMHFLRRLKLIQASNAIFDQIAVSDLAEQMSLIDHHLFCALESE